MAATERPAGPYTENGITYDADGSVLSRYSEYARWAIGPLMDREQWEADQRLLYGDFPAWRKRHNI